MKETEFDLYKKLVEQQGQRLIDGLKTVIQGNLDVDFEVSDDIGVFSELAAELHNLVDYIRETTSQADQHGSVETQAALTRTEALYQVSSTLISPENLTDLLQKVVDTVAEALPASGTALSIVDMEKRQIIHDVLNNLQHPFDSYNEMWEGLAGWVLREKRPALSPKGALDPRESPFVQQRRADEGVGCVIVVPLIYRDKGIGSLVAVNLIDEPDFTEEDVKLMMTMAGQIAVAIHDHQAQEELRTHRNHLQELVTERTAALTKTSLRLEQKITERNQMETALAEERNLLRTLIDNLPDYIYIKDIEHRFQLINDATRQHLGAATIEEVVGKTDFDFSPPELAAQYYADEQEIFTSGQAMIGHEEPMFDHKTGTQKWVLTTKVPRRDRQGRIVGLVGMNRDITVLKQAEAVRQMYSEQLEETVQARTEALQTAQARLSRQEKFAVLGQLAGGVAHELRNPLGVISNAVYYLRLVLDETDETIKEYLYIIDTRIHEVSKIVSDLLDFTHTEVVRRENVSVSTLIASVLERHPPPPEVMVVEKLEANLTPVFVNAQQIGQVLANLITNAYQAMPSGGRLTFSAQASANQVQLAVTDTGFGIAPDTQQQIFEPLFSTKVHGIGLGLAVVKNLIELNGGHIDLESTPGRGSTFIVTLPATKP